MWAEKKKWTGDAFQLEHGDGLCSAEVEPEVMTEAEPEVMSEVEPEVEIDDGPVIGECLSHADGFYHIICGRCGADFKGRSIPTGKSGTKLKVINREWAGAITLGQSLPEPLWPCALTYLDDSHCGQRRRNGPVMPSNLSMGLACAHQRWSQR